MAAGVTIEWNRRAGYVVPGLDTDRSLQDEASGGERQIPVGGKGPVVRSVSLGGGPRPLAYAAVYAVTVSTAKGDEHPELAFHPIELGTVVAFRVECDPYAQVLHQPYVGHLGMKRHWQAGSGLNRTLPETPVCPSARCPAGHGQNKAKNRNE